jgi:hypothetical protein
MCFSVESSLAVWVLSLVIAVYLYQRNRNYDRWNSAFIITVSTIQLLEAGLWVSLNDPKKNDILTRLILLTLLAEPLVQSYMGYRYTRRAFLQVFTWIFTGFFIWGLIRVISAKPGQFHSDISSSGRLAWKDSGSSSFVKWAPLWLAGLLLPLLFMKGYRGIPLLVVGLGTMAYSWYITSGKGASSLWCFLAIIYSITALFV